jgi:hypothetical protein
MSGYGHVRNGSDSDVGGQNRDVCFAPANGLHQAALACPFRATTGLMRCSKHNLIRSLRRRENTTPAVPR